VLIDLLTGIRKSHHLNGITSNPFRREFWLGKPGPRPDGDASRVGGVRSYLLRQTWRKLYEYLFGILAVHLVEAHMLDGLEVEVTGGTGTLTKWAVSVAGVVELWSIFENMETVGGRNPLKRLSGLLPEKVRRVLDGE